VGSFRTLESDLPCPPLQKDAELSCSTVCIMNDYEMGNSVCLILACRPDVGTLSVGRTPLPFLLYQSANDGVRAFRKFVYRYAAARVSK
jgi:hypothetical protein